MIYALPIITRTNKSPSGLEVELILIAKLHRCMMFSHEIQFVEAGFERNFDSKFGSSHILQEKSNIITWLLFRM